MRQNDLYVNAFDRRPRGKGIFFYWTVLALVFLAAALASYALTPAAHSSVVAQALRNKAFLGQFKFILGLQPAWMMLAIWVKNMIVALLLLTIGGYLGGLVSYLVIVFNAVVLGVLVKTLHASGATFRFVLAGLLPHGIIELSAIFLAGALAIWAVQRQLRFSRRLTGGLRWVAPLLLVAAAIETFVTPLVMAHFR
ncbi:MAG TPA: stage II sporulation protein M [Spirochaetia bacterium]|nr:stage II sporulation protein M [Spirochaetia bacterium]